MAINENGDTVFNITSENSNETIELATAGTYTDKNIIFNIYRGGGGGSGTDTSDATAAASDILFGKTAYVNGGKITGTIPSKSATTTYLGDSSVGTTTTLAAGQYLAGNQIYKVQTKSLTVTNENIAQGAVITPGTDNGHQSYFDSVTIVKDNNLKAENIKSGVSIFGITGSVVEGTSVNLQSNKTITPSTTQQKVSADSGYDGLAQVTVNAIPSNYIVPSGNYEITSNGSNINIAKYATVSVNVPTTETPAAGSITNNTTKPYNVTSSGTINSGSYIKIGAGNYNNDLYYQAASFKSQTKTVTPSTSTQNITPDSTYDGLSKVTVNPIPSTYIQPSGSKTYTANASNIDVKALATITIAVPASTVNVSANNATLETTNNSGISVSASDTKYIKDITLTNSKAVTIKTGVDWTFTKDSSGNIKIT